MKTVKIKIEKSNPSRNGEFKWAEFPLSAQTLELTKAKKSNGSSYISRISLEKQKIFILVPAAATELIYSPELNIAQVKTEQ